MKLMFWQWKLHIFELEKEMKITPSIKYVIYPVFLHKSLITFLSGCEQKCHSIGLQRTLFFYPVLIESLRPFNSTRLDVISSITFNFKLPQSAIFQFSLILEMNTLIFYIETEINDCVTQQYFS